MIFKKLKIAFGFMVLRFIWVLKMGLLAQHPIIKGPPYGPEGALSLKATLLGSNHAYQFI